jgi:hypothetical protein
MTARQVAVDLRARLDVKDPRGCSTTSMHAACGSGPVDQVSDRFRAGTA